MTSQTALSPARGAKQLPQWIDARHTMPGTGLRLAMGLLERWQRRRWRRQLRNLCELDDHILQDIGLTRSALRCAANQPLLP
jgi:uncharacterized protein YjiS (DUF1127 family)